MKIDIIKLAKLVGKLIMASPLVVASVKPVLQELKKPKVHK